MNDHDKTSQQLIDELDRLRQRVATLEAHHDEHGRAEEALQKAHDELEQKVRERTAELAIFRTFADASLEAFAMCGLDTRILYVNPAMLRLCGETRLEDVLGKSYLMYYPGDFRQKVETQFRSGVQDQGQWSGELEFLTKTGQQKTVLAIGYQIQDDAGGPTRVAVVMTDITQRKLAEQALKQAHDELRAIQDALVDGLIVTDIETLKVVRANESISKMLGYSSAELVSLSVRDLHPPDVVPYISERIRAIADMDVLPSGEIPFLRKDGSVFYAEINGRLLNYNGRPCAMGLVRDITERKKTQTVLERERQTLKHMLQSSDHERQIIAYEIHDGLAQYLASSIMQFEVFHHFRESNPDGAQKAFDAAMTLLRQSHADARRLISGVRPPILDEEGLAAAISHLVNEYRRQQRAEIELRIDINFDRLATPLENALFRIAQESLTNACKHSTSPRIRVELVQQDDTVRVLVQDWGAGFDPDTVADNRFGLAGMRERARLLGGHFSIETAPGNGTRVSVELPVVPNLADKDKKGISPISRNNPASL